ncbi:hexameric tyrosine-coordinated heme protein, partial [Blastomonas sp.]|uniref:hexameric tyrosine-coordinated heme protein n=1 Tax=Blastomonas sp. TaxID=1909299 RepID=UPI00359388DA
MSRMGVKDTQPDEAVRDKLRSQYGHDARALIAISQTVAVNFATIAAANDYWQDREKGGKDMTVPLRPAPPLEVVQWLNVAEPLTLDYLLGRVILIEAFQMLCPGCVSHGLPQATRVRETFSEKDVVVIGLHS